MEILINFKPHITMKKIVYIVLALPLLLAGCKDKKSDKKSATAGYVPSITVATPVVKDMVLSKEYPGYLSSEQTVNLVGRVNGTLESIKFKPGERVKKGQLLFVIEPTVYQNEVSQAQAELESSKAELEYSESNYTRMQEALKSDAVSQIQVIQAESTMKGDRASIANNEAALKTAQTNLNYCYVKAPFDGVISKNAVDIGSYISGAASPVTLATIYKDDKMYSYFNIADNQWLTMQMQMAANKPVDQLPHDILVKLGADDIKNYPATLDYMSPDVTMNTGTVTLRAILDNPDGILKSGLYVSVSLPYAEVKDAILINNGSIGSDQLGKYVYVVNDSNIVNYRHITTGELFGDTLRLVTSGLKPNEKYVTTALLKVKNGMKVKPVTK